MTSDNKKTIKSKFQGEAEFEDGTDVVVMMNKIQECLDNHGEEYGIYDATVKGIKRGGN